MCSCNELLGDCHYRSEQEYRDECERIAAASALDWEVLDVLHGEPVEASERAEAFAALLAPHRASIVDIMSGDGCLWWWSADGDEHRVYLADAQADTVPALRLAA
ncbi:hypothetical protein [Paraburkholderia sp.]|uniref:hypothetical protein n=1 Tax=Paraburkholderia sp. TaxID=1926495 RepID=UPI0039E341E4